MTQPYRSPSVEPQFLCIVCYENTLAAPGNCPRCGVPMQPIADAEVQAELRKRAAAKKKRINSRRLRFVAVSSIAIAFAVNVLLIVKGVYDFGATAGTTRMRSSGFYVFMFLLPLIASLPLMSGVDWVVGRLGLFSETAKIDPDTAPTSELLRFLAVA